MLKYLRSIGDYLQYKVLAGLWATLWSDDLPQLFFLFIFLELLDIFTRWLALSAACYKAIYPQSKGNLFIYLRFMYQARRWRFIRSTGLRDGFCDKVLTYCLLLLLAATVDAALSIGHAPRIMLTVTVSVLAMTEGLSVLENMGEAGVTVIKDIKAKLLKKKEI